MKSNLKRFFGAVTLVLVWTVAALIVNDNLILPKISEVIKRLVSMFMYDGLFSQIVVSTSRVFLGISCSIIIGNIFAYFSFKKNLYSFFEPLFSLIKSTPVISFILIVLFFTKKNMLSIIVVFFVSIPVIYENVLNGLKNIDSKKSELFKIYNVSNEKRFLYLYLPVIIKKTLLSLKISTGMAFKAGSTSEVISGASGGLGEVMYLSKLTFEMADLIGVTFIIIFVSFLIEMIISRVFKGVNEKYD